jgi:osmotically-inducible protein OsmY
MAMKCRWLIVLSLFVIWPVGTRSHASDHDKEGLSEKSTSGSSQPPVAPPGTSDTATEHKETVPEKPAVRQQPSSASSDAQPTPHKQPAESKPTKAESSTDRREGVSEKPVSSSSQPPAVPPVKNEAATEHKEASPEKPAVRQPPSPASSEPQPTPHKSPVEPKSTSLPSTPTKAEPSTDRKEGTLEKIPARPSSSPAVTEGHSTSPKPSGETKLQGQPAPAVKADLQPSADIDLKEKETAAKKSVGSLILSVKLALMGDMRLFHYEIEVEDDKQVVTLTGRVSNEEDKVAATDVAQAVTGVKTVTNKLIVEKDLAKTLLKKQDEILTLLIKERFAKSATLKSANFDVKTEEGVVQLNGTVRFQVIALEAAEAARQVPGVRAVNTEKIRLEGES